MSTEHTMDKGDSVVHGLTTAVGKLELCSQEETNYP